MDKFIYTPLSSDFVQAVINGGHKVGNPKHIPLGYKIIANEDQTLNFTEPTDIAYGADGKFMFAKGVTGEVTFNNTMFGDPLNGTVKYGFMKVPYHNLIIVVTVILTLVGVYFLYKHLN